MDNNLIALNEKLTAIAENEQRVFDAGKAKRDYEWWDKVAPTTRYSYVYAFFGPWWTDDVYNPVRELTIANASSSPNSTYMYGGSMITDTKVPINLSTNAERVYNLVNTFTSATYLKTIRKLIVNERIAMDNQFTSCTALENLTIEGTIGQNFNAQWCPLTEESILSVVTHLSDTTSGLTCTFKSTAVEAAFTTEEWNALVATKPNWTFAKA